MIRYIFKNKMVFVCLLIMFLYGYIEGNLLYSGSENYKMIESYVITFNLRPLIYGLIIFNIFFDYILFRNCFCPSFIVRYDSLLGFLKQNLKIEVLLSSFLFLFFHIGLFVQHISLFFICFPAIIKLFINYLIITFLLISIVKIIDVKIRNQVVSSVLLTGIIAFLDIGSSIYNVLFRTNLELSIQSIYVLPYEYKNYILIAIVLLGISIFLMSLSSYLMTKKDYLIRSNNEES